MVLILTRDENAVQRKFNTSFKFLCTNSKFNSIFSFYGDVVGKKIYHRLQSDHMIISLDLKALAKSKLDWTIHFQFYSRLSNSNSGNNKSITMHEKSFRNKSKSLHFTVNFSCKNSNLSNTRKISHLNVLMVPSKTKIRIISYLKTWVLNKNTKKFLCKNNFSYSFDKFVNKDYVKKNLTSFVYQCTSNFSFPSAFRSFFGVFAFLDFQV